MYDSALFTDAKSTLESARGLGQLLALLPAGAELSVILDDRIPCALTRDSDTLKLLPRPCPAADLEIVLFSESVRRLRDVSPPDLMSLLKELSSLALSGHVKAKLLSPVQTLYSKGYLDALRNLAPDIQSELQKYAYLLLGEAARAVATIKTFLKR
jgi:hypothetical protein